MSIKKRSVTIKGHRTSFSLEEPFFAELERMASNRGMSLAQLVAQIDENRDRQTNLSSAMRLAILAELTKNQESR